MGSIVCAGAGAKSKWRAATPLGRTGELPGRKAAGREAVPPPEFGPSAGQIVDADLLWAREKGTAYGGARLRYDRLLLCVAADRTPLDSVLPQAEFYFAFFEAFFLAAATWPQFYPVDDDPASEPWTEADAAEMGLYVTRPPRKRDLLTAPTLPGCQAKDDAGTPCSCLRRYGARYCPDHERSERQRLRQAASVP